MTDEEREHHRSHMEVVPGVAPPANINPNFVRARRQAPPGAAELFERIQAGDRGALSQGITLIESRLPATQKEVAQLLDLTLAHPRPSLRVGITGAPGVGKSTLIEVLGLHVLDKIGKRLAVLAIDPTSTATHGSILGDKSRMPNLSVHDGAFVRPSPSSGSLGGVAHQTRESIALCESAGYEVVFVETVGVGQSEIAVHGMVDCFLLLALAGAGDELQGIKRGVMEMADVFAVTKADGENVNRAKLARQQIVNALHLMAPLDSGWSPPVLLCSSITGDGLAELWGDIERYAARMGESGEFHRRRQRQAVEWMRDLVRRRIVDDLFAKPAIEARRQELERDVREGALSPRSGANLLLEFMRQWDS